MKEVVGGTRKGKGFQTAGTAGAKVQRLVCAWCFWGAALEATVARVE